MDEFLVDSAGLAKNFGVDPDTGLTDDMVRENAVKWGTNALARVAPESLLKRIWNSATDPLLLLLLLAALVALGVNITAVVTGGEANILEVVGIFTAIFLSVAITVAMEGKSAKAFEALNKINEDIVVKALRNGGPVMLNQRDIVAGDILLLATGDKIPADGRLLESTELSADESSLTGESVPVKKNADFIPTDKKTPLAERRNMLYSGTYVTNGFGKLLVTAVGCKTEFGKIARELGGSQKTTTPLQERLGRMGKLITYVGAGAAAVLFASQLISFAHSDAITFKNITEAFLISIVLIVACVPEGLPTIVAISLSLNIIKLSKQNALVKKIIASETVGCINVICSDKTGTLTENKMTVNGSITDELVLRNICVNSTAEIGKGGVFIGNPTECALLTAAGKSGYDYHKQRQNAKIARVFPFSSEKKNMTTVVRDDKGLIAYSKGGPEKIFQLCGIDGAKRAEIEREITVWQEKACRIIAFAHRRLDECQIDDEGLYNEDTVESDMTFDGFAAISDPLRHDVFDAVSQCRSAGINLKILTGDNIVTATAIANELGVLSNENIAVEAREIEHLSDDELSAQLTKIAVIARSTPAIKMRVVNLLKAAGNVVAVTGDGINDAPALKNADVGIAMGIAGTEVSKEASDIVLLNDSFATIVNAVRWGRGIYDNFKRFICFQLTVNAAAVVTVLASIILGLKTPFTALQLLWINIVMDGPPAITLGLEPIHGDLMKRPPIKRSENILSRPLLIKIGLSGLYISTITLLQHKFDFLGAGEEHAHTVLFTMFTMFALFNAFNCREIHITTIFRHFLKNRLMLAVTGSTILAQVLIIQFAGSIFNTKPLSLDLWIKIFAIAGSVVAVSEIIKFVLKVRESKIKAFKVFKIKFFFGDRGS
ncbi:MAG: calcium-translocating P-type ATPase, PMCA-type [Chitinispirillales bacterium]|nr:calcium-translocating P-type ATPase, PMCA-type [Chitinispirillales bacterium]